MIDAVALTAAIKAAGCPIDGVSGPFDSPSECPSDWSVYPASDGSYWRLVFSAGDTDAQRQAGTDALASYAPSVPKPFLTGRDILDGMSPGQARVANDADPRNLDRIAGARTAAEVKSCIKRVAAANNMTYDALIAQATATGGP